MSSRNPDSPGPAPGAARGAPGGRIAVVSGCVAIFWPGAFIFGFPGLMGPFWQETFGVSRAAAGRTLFFVLAAVGLFMFLTGRWQEKLGPSRLATLGALLCGVSTILVSWAESMAWVYGWAFVMGAASSFVYIPALTVVQRWHPSRKGLVSGWVNLAFGLSAAIMSPVFTTLLGVMSARAMTLLVGLAALAAGLAAASHLRFPEAKDAVKGAAGQPLAPPRTSFHLAEALRTRSFWLIWGTWAMAGAGGIAMVTLSVSFGLSKGLAVGDAVVILTAFNLTNGTSRFVSGYLSDRIGRNRMMGSAFFCAACAYWLFPGLEGLTAWALLAAVVGFAFGTLFAVSAPLVADFFGMQHFGVIFGLVFTAYGFVAGALGPWLSGYVLDVSGGNFTSVFSYLGGFYLLSAILIAFTKPPEGAGGGAL